MKEDYVGLNDIEKKLQYEYDMCCYAQQYTDTDLDCDNIKKRNSKIKLILIFNTLKESNLLPIIYRKNSSDPMTFDDYYKFVK